VSAQAADLRRIDIFADLSDEDIAWLAERCRVEDLAAGDAVVLEGQPADEMIGVVHGELHARREHGPPDGRFVLVRSGEVGAMLPFSRMKIFPVTSRAVKPTRIVRIPASLFPEMLRRMPALEPRLVAVLADRARQDTRDVLQREALLGLGKLAAGLAHELNNPAAAVRSAAGQLRERLADLSHRSVDLAGEELPADAMEALRDLPAGVLEPMAADNPLERMQREEELTSWLESKGVDRPWDVAEAFLDAGLSTPAVAALAARLPDASAVPGLLWAADVLAVRRLLLDIENAAERISQLVGAVKTYSHLDQAPDKTETDVRTGIDSTLAILGHKLRAKHLTVERQYAPDLPLVVGHPGELNQVWTNIIDNAIDALPDGGRISIRATAEPGYLLVEVADNGPGVQPELAGRVFEPFFTTKDVGQGTGLGLDIVRRIIQRRHGGEVRLESVPGDTRFEIRLPLSGPTDAES
jgi:signal transduction histidine kinase